MVVGLDLECDRPAAGKSQYACILARTLDDLRPRRRKGLQDRLRVLIGAVLAPQRREDAQLGERRRAAEQGDDAIVFFGCEVVLLHQLGGDGGIGGTHLRVTPFATARNTLPRMLGGDVFMNACASSA